MYGMFTSCYNIKILNLKKFDTSNVRNMSTMFSNCSSLTSLDLSSFDTSKVTDMSYMFSGCDRLTSLDVSNFDTSKVTDMSSMFDSCSGLTSLDLSSFNTSEVTDMSRMFYSGHAEIPVALEVLDLRNATFENVTKYDGMFLFSHANNLKVITKDATTKAWLEDKLGGKGTVVIA